MLSDSKSEVNLKLGDSLFSFPKNKWCIIPRKYQRVFRYISSLGMFKNTPNVHLHVLFMNRFATKDDAGDRIATLVGC